MKKNIIPIVFSLMIYLGIAIYIIKSDAYNVYYGNNNNEIYTIYLDGEVNYKGSLDLNKGTKIGDFIYDYLTSKSDYESFNPSEYIQNYKLYYIAYKEKLNINIATKKELMALDGVGDVYSNSIISGRPYKDIKELRTRNIIGQALYDSIKNQICCE